LKPRIKILLAKLINVGVAVDIDVVSRLSDFNTVKYTQQPLTFQGNRQLVVDKVEKDVSRFLIRGRDGKIVNLTFEDNPFDSNGARVQTWLMGGWSKTQVTENHISVLLLKTGRFWVALHSQESRNNVARRDRWSTFVVNPPFMKCPVRSDIEALFW
jgi:hypothetical protein